MIIRLFARIQLWFWRLRGTEPSNKKLNELFIEVDKIVIKGDGVINNRALSNDILLELNNTNKIKIFHELIEIIEPGTGGMCCCLGDFAIELHSKGKVKTVLGLHHSETIRYEYWNCDAELAKKEGFLEFLNQEGLSEPLLLYKGEIESIIN
jgi:hypothetical protein